MNLRQYIEVLQNFALKHPEHLNTTVISQNIYQTMTDFDEVKKKPSLAVVDYPEKVIEMDEEGEYEPNAIIINNI